MEIHRSGYRHLLASALDVSAEFYREFGDDELEAFIQSTTEMS